MKYSPMLTLTAIMLFYFVESIAAASNHWPVSPFQIEMQTAVSLATSRIWAKVFDESEDDE